MLLLLLWDIINISGRYIKGEMQYNNNRTCILHVLNYNLFKINELYSV